MNADSVIRIGPGLLAGAFSFALILDHFGLL